MPVLQVAELQEQYRLSTEEAAGRAAAGVAADAAMGGGAGAALHGT